MAFVPNFLTLRSVYVSGKSEIVEGVVRDFHAAPQLGPARESFSVGDESFTYNSLDETPCFHDTPIHRGPIHEGLNVRIHYHDGCIQKVEVSER